VQGSDAAAPAAASSPDPAATAPPYDGLDTLQDPPSPDADGAATDARARAHARPLSPSARGEGEPPPLATRAAFMPFGAGARCCLGQRLAVGTLKAALGTLLPYVAFAPGGGLAAAAAAGGGAPAGGAGVAVAVGLWLRPGGSGRLPLQVQRTSSTKWA
jgi:hypothetical protein